MRGHGRVWDRRPGSLCMEVSMMPMLAISVTGTDERGLRGGGIEEWRSARSRRLW